MTRYKWLILPVLMLLAATAAVQAQMPSTPKRLFSEFEQRAFLKAGCGFSRCVTVDADGNGSFSTIKAACDYVATQPRSSATQWVVLVYNGSAQPAEGYDDWYNYNESPFTVPTWTVVQGVSAVHNTPTLSGLGGPLVRFSATSGTMITLADGAALVNLQMLYYGAPSGAVTMIQSAAAGINVIENVSVQMFPLVDTQTMTGIQSTGTGALYLYDSSSTLADGAVGSTLISAGSATGTTIYGGRWNASVICGALLTATAGPLKLYDVRIDGGGCTLDLKTTGGGTIAVKDSPYTSKSGTITHLDGSQGLMTCPLLSGAGSPEGGVAAAVCALYLDTAAQGRAYQKASGTGNTGWKAMARASSGTTAPATCSVGELFTDTDLPGICACTAADTWKCAAGL